MTAPVLRAKFVLPGRQPKQWPKFGDQRLPPDFWMLIEVDSHHCWNWGGSREGSGYGRYYFKGKNNSAYRFSYEALVGLIPRHLQIDHTCQNPSCVNPEHLEPVTQAENARRAGARATARRGLRRDHPRRKKKSKFATGEMHV